MSSSETSAARLLQCLHSVAPRSKHSVSHPFHTVIPGLPAGISPISPIAEILKRISIKDLQNDFRNLFFAIGRRRIACIRRRTRRAALGEVWTFLTEMAGTVVRLTKKKDRTLREVRERLRAKPQNARQM
ncbi:MAG: hypothetical protein LBH00_03460 [Planctomycetaceae bacterium]|nr:hypothetical protein [Planctomycetaceae bacterium]